MADQENRQRALDDALKNIFDNQNSWLVSADHSEKIIFRDYKGEIQEVILEKGYCIDIMEKVITWARSYFQNEKSF